MFVLPEHMCMSLYRKWIKAIPQGGDPTKDFHIQLYKKVANTLKEKGQLTDASLIISTIIIT